MLKFECVKNGIENEFGKKLVGELLTLVDMSGLDLNAKKAFKDMIRQTIYRNCGSTLELLSQIEKKEELQNE